MGARCVGHGGHVPPRFCEANVKSLILTIGAPPYLYCALPVLLMCPPVFIVTGRPSLKLLVKTFTKVKVTVNF